MSAILSRPQCVNKGTILIICSQFVVFRYRSGVGRLLSWQRVHCTIVPVPVKQLWKDRRKLIPWITNTCRHNQGEYKAKQMREYIFYAWTVTWANKPAHIVVRIANTVCTIINTLGPRQNGRHFPDDIFRCIFVNWLKFHWIFFAKDPIDNNPALV